MYEINHRLQWRGQKHVPHGCSEGPIHRIVGQLVEKGHPKMGPAVNFWDAPNTSTLQLQWRSHLITHLYKRTAQIRWKTLPLLLLPILPILYYIIWQPLSSFLLQQFLTFQHACQPCLCWWSNAASMVSSQAETGDVESNLGMG